MRARSAVTLQECLCSSRGWRGCSRGVGFILIPSAKHSKKQAVITLLRNYLYFILLYKGKCYKYWMALYLYPESRRICKVGSMSFWGKASPSIHYILFLHRPALRNPWTKCRAKTAWQKYFKIENMQVMDVVLTRRRWKHRFICSFPNLLPSWYWLPAPGHALKAALSCAGSSSPLWSGLCSKLAATTSEGKVCPWGI